MRFLKFFGINIPAKEILRKIFRRSEIKYLGRWQTLQCEKKVNSRVDWANEDHCGPCGIEPIKQNNKENNKEKIIKKTDKEFNRNQ